VISVVNGLQAACLRCLASALFCVPVLASSWSGVVDAAGPGTVVVLCGVVAANPTTSGEGSGPGTFELRVTSGPPGTAPTSVFGVATSVPQPTIGSYICGEFQEGVPMNGLMTLLRPGDPGYVARSLPSTSVQRDADIAISSPELVVTGLGVLAAAGWLIARSRRSSATG
jgi:hypothetical protein